MRLSIHIRPDEIATIPDSSPLRFRIVNAIVRQADAIEKRNARRVARAEAMLAEAMNEKHEDAATIDAARREYYGTVGEVVAVRESKRAAFKRITRAEG